MDRIRDLFLKISLITLAIVIWGFIGFAIWKAFSNPPEKNIVLSQVPPINNGEILLNNSYYLIQRNSLKAITNPAIIKLRILGTMIGNGLDYDQAILIDKIIERESGGNPSICNQQFGCKAGMGLTQLIPSTIKYCEEKLGKKIDPFNPEQNLECAIWLLTNEGIKHWESYSGPY